MQKIMFDDKFGLTQAVLNGSKTMTRRIEPTLSQLPEDIAEDEYLIQNIREDSILVERCYKGAKLSSWIIRPRFYLCEEVAIAQSYDNIVWHTNPNAPVLLSREVEKLQHTAGWTNKMFVKPNLMPHRIRITDYRVERLQNISDDDCLKEGIRYAPMRNEDNYKSYTFDGWKRKRNGFDYDCYAINPHEAFRVLIDKMSGKGTWNRNPWVLVYSFELVK